MKLQSKKVAIMLSILAITAVGFTGCGFGDFSHKEKTQTEEKVTMVEMVYYLPVDDGRGVIRQSVTVPEKEANVTNALKKVLEIEQRNPYSVFPKNMKIESVTVKDHIATIHCNEALLNSVNSGALTEQLMLASLSNTAAQYEDIKGILFTVNGEPLLSLGKGYYDLNTPLAPMTQLIVE